MARVRSARAAKPVGSTPAGASGRIGGASLAFICILLLISLLVRSSPPMLPILIVLPMAWIAWRSSLAPAYLLVAATPLQSIGLRHLSFSLIDAVLLLLILKVAISIARGTPARDQLKWPRGPIGIALAAFLFFTVASGAAPAIHLVREFFDAGWRLGILSVAQAIFAGTTDPLAQIWHHAAIAFLFMHLAGRPLSADPSRGWARTVVPAAGLLGALAIIERIVSAHWGLRTMVKIVGKSFTLGRIPGPFRWPTQLATYMDLILPTVLALTILRGRTSRGGDDAGRNGKFAERHRTSRRWLDGRTARLAVFAALGIAALYLALTRSGWIGLLLSCAAIIVLGLRGGESRRRLIVSAALLTLALAPLTFDLWRARADMAKMPGGRQEGGRTEYVWPTAIHMIRAHPWFGCGLGMWRTASTEYAPYALTETRSERVHAHNIFLQVASESGIPAALALLAIIGLVAWRLWRRSWGGDPVSIGLAATLPGYLFHGMFENTLFPPELFLSFWVFVAIAMARAGDPDADARAEPVVMRERWDASTAPETNP